MKLYQYFQAYDFDEVYPYIGVMYPKGRDERKEFRQAYDILRQMTPTMSNKKIHFELMGDPEKDEMFFGADDSNFQSTWDVLLGKEVKVDANVKLTQDEIVANCLLNTVLQGRHPKAFDAAFRRLKA